MQVKNNFDVSSTIPFSGGGEFNYKQAYLSYFQIFPGQRLRALLAYIKNPKYHKFLFIIDIQLLYWPNLTHAQRNTI